LKPGQFRFECILPRADVSNLLPQEVFIDLGELKQLYQPSFLVLA